MSETRSITRPLLRALNQIPGVKFERINSGVIALPGRHVHLAEDGTPDLIGCVRGRCCLIETKRPGGKTDKKREENQRRVQAMWALAGAVVFGDVQSVADGVSLVRGVLEGRKVA